MGCRFIMSEMKTQTKLGNLRVRVPGWLRAIYVLFGLIGVSLSVLILSYPNLGQLNQILILVTAVFVFGLARITVGLFAVHLPVRLRAFSIGLGVFGISVTLIAIMGQMYLTQTLAQLLSAVLLFNGAISIFIGGFVETIPRISRITLFALGLVCIASSVWTFMLSPFPLSSSINLLSVGFLSNGIAHIVEGATRTKLRK